MFWREIIYMKEMNFKKALDFYKTALTKVIATKKEQDHIKNADIEM